MKVAFFPPERDCARTPRHTALPRSVSHVPCANPTPLPKIELTHMVDSSAKGTMLTAISRSDVTGHWEVTLMKTKGRLPPCFCWTKVTFDPLWYRNENCRFIRMFRVGLCPIRSHYVRWLHIHRADKSRWNIIGLAVVWAWCVCAGVNLSI